MEGEGVLLVIVFFPVVCCFLLIAQIVKAFCENPDLGQNCCNMICWCITDPTQQEKCLHLFCNCCVCVGNNAIKECVRSCEQTRCCEMCIDTCFDGCVKTNCQRVGIENGFMGICTCIITLVVFFGCLCFIPLLILLFAGPVTLIGGLTSASFVDPETFAHNTEIDDWEMQEYFVSELDTKAFSIDLSYPNIDSLSYSDNTVFSHLYLEQTFAGSDSEYSKLYYNTLSSIGDQMYPGLGDVNNKKVSLSINWIDYGYPSYSTNLEVEIFKSEIYDCYYEEKCDRCCYYRYGVNSWCEGHERSNCLHSTCYTCTDCKYQYDSCEKIYKLSKVCLVIPDEDEFADGFVLETCDSVYGSNYGEESVQYELITKPVQHQLDFVVDVYPQSLLRIGETLDYESEGIVSLSANDQLVSGAILTAVIWGPCILIICCVVLGLVIFCISADKKNKNSSLKEVEKDFKKQELKNSQNAQVQQNQNVRVTVQQQTVTRAPVQQHVITQVPMQQQVVRQVPMQQQMVRQVQPVVRQVPVQMVRQQPVVQQRVMYVPVQNVQNQQPMYVNQIHPQYVMQNQQQQMMFQQQQQQFQLQQQRLRQQQMRIQQQQMQIQQQQNLYQPQQNPQFRQ